MSVNSDPQVTKRLFAILVLMIGLMCVFAGYLFGRHSDGKRQPDFLTHNLTIAAELLYKKAKRILPKTAPPETVRSRLTDIFNCTCCQCPLLDKFNLAEFVKYSVNAQVLKVLKSVQNASMYLDKYNKSLA